MMRLLRERAKEYSQPTDEYGDVVRVHVALVYNAPKRMYEFKSFHEITDW